MKNKNLLVFTLFFAAALNAAFAQRQLTPATLKNIHKLPASAQNLFERNGFDLKADLGAQNRNELVLDSTKTFYGYIGADSTPLFRSVYAYPNANVKVQTSSEWAGTWFLTSRATFISDDQGRGIEVIAEYHNGADWVNDSRLEMFPHGDTPDLLDSFKTYIWDANIGEWFLALKGTTTYDAQDRITEAHTYLYFLGGEQVFRENYTYDANGNNILIEEVAVFDGMEFPSGLTQNTFTNNQLTEVVASIHDGVEYVLQSRATFTYTNFGAVKTDFGYEWNFDSLNWIQTQAIVYEYDAQQRTESKATTFIHVDGPNEYELIRYAYVEGENLAHETIYLRNENEPEWTLDSKTYYYYNGTTAVTPQPVKALAMNVYPNPTTGRIRIGFDAEADVRVFNAAGKLLQTAVLQPGQELDLSALPAGMYYLTAHKELDYYAGKVFKH